MPDFISEHLVTIGLDEGVHYIYINTTHIQDGVFVFTYMPSTLRSRSYQIESMQAINQHIHTSKTSCKHDGFDGSQGAVSLLLGVGPGSLCDIMDMLSEAGWLLIYQPCYTGWDYIMAPPN